MNLNAAITAYFYAKHALSPRTHAWYEQKLAAWAAWTVAHRCPLHPHPATDIEAVDASHVNEYLAHLKTVPSTALNHGGRPAGSHAIHGNARAIKAFLRWCVREDLVLERVTRRLEMPRREQKVIPVLTADDIRRLLAACERPKGDLYPWMAERDRTILMLLLDTGLRAGELCGLEIADVHLDRSDPYIKVTGKGRKEREIGLGITARQQMHRWLYRYRPDTAPDTRAVFNTRDRAALDAKGLAALLRRLKEAAGITHIRCSPHDFRHTFSFSFLAHGGDVMRLSRLLGHTSLAVTSGYLSAFQSRDARRGSISPLSHSLDAAEDEREDELLSSERCLLYVAMTRTRGALYLLHGLLQPSRFLDELDSARYTRTAPELLPVTVQVPG
jgi:integrase/recombinase XerD